MPPTADQVADKPPHDDAPNELDCCNILVVDDQITNVQLIEASLVGLGLRIITARSGADALEKARDLDLVLVLMDIRMPGMSGIDATIELRKQPRHAKTPVIFVTAYTPEDQEILGGYQAGAIDYLFKPLMPQVLRAKVSAFAEMYRSNCEAKRQAALEATRRQLEQDKIQLEKQAQRRDEFLAMLAHELRNPLAPISAAAELLQLVRHDENRVRQTSEVIERQVRHMTNLVDDLLDVSRVTRGLVELKRAPVDIRQVITDAVEQVSSLIRGRQHQLTLQLSSDTAYVMGDRNRLVQVMSNLLNNAAKYTEECGKILVRTEVHEAQILIEVVDNGIGIPPELLGQVFELFSQAERTPDRSTGGLGVGLALVKSLVQFHGGSVSCRSDGGGKGSSFTVCLPRTTTPEPQQAEPVNHNALTTASRPLQVLVVDDNADAAILLAMLLEATGHRVSVEHQSLGALERARAEAPDVCLLDIGLPEIDGNELAKRLRAQPETAHSVLIAVTGYGQERDRAQSRAAGFDHHLVKPVDTAKLVAILEAIGNKKTG